MSSKNKQSLYGYKSQDKSNLATLGDLWNTFKPGLYDTNHSAGIMWILQMDYIIWESRKYIGIHYFDKKLNKDKSTTVDNSKKNMNEWNPVVAHKPIMLQHFEVCYDNEYSVPLT